MAKTMQALIVEGRESYRVTEVPVPEPGEREVLIKVDSCGLCGTDIHIYRGQFFANFPLIIGHEIAGKVVEMGGKVEKLKKGDSVVVNPNINCGLCYFCQRSEIHLCENLMNIGVRINGGFAEYVTVEESFVYPLSDKVDLEAASLVEPLSCSIHGADIAGTKSGDRVVILGAGPIGLIILQLVKLAGAAKLMVVDPVEKRRKIAEELGADFTLDPTEVDILNSIPGILGQPPDIVIECVGRGETMQQSWKMVNCGGKVVWFGVADPEEEIIINPYQIYRKEIKIAGSFINPHTTGRAVQLLEGGKMKLKELITHRFSLDEFPKAIDTYEKDKERIKIVIKPGNVRRKHRGQVLTFKF
jgi:2-desacetyl-2-hydroxyethyl bacteriochlorophyllide A dehydrogenase